MQKRECGIRVAAISLLLIIFCTLLSFAGGSNVYAKDAIDNELAIHFIDVGQGDCIFIELPDGKTMLIDGGRKEYGKWVVDYIKDLGVTKIDYMVATHSDEDHIGGLISVLDNFEVKIIFRPFDVSKFTTENGFKDELYLKFGADIEDKYLVFDETYANFLEKAYAEMADGEFSEIKICSDKISLLSESAENPYIIKFYMPKGVETFSTDRITNGYRVKQVEDKNETSAIILLTTIYHNYLFCGDANTNSEKEFINSLSASNKEAVSNISLLKVGHHGSKTSTSQEFIDLLKPENAVIMVGADNDYGHPDDGVIERLEDAGTAIYRTDECGNITVREDGDILRFTASRAREKKYVWIIYLLVGGVIFVIALVSLIYPKLKEKLQKGKFKKIT